MNDQERDLLCLIGDALLHLLYSLPEDHDDQEHIGADRMALEDAIDRIRESQRHHRYLKSIGEMS